MHLPHFLRVLAALPSQFTTLLQLLQEQNSLLRELIQFHTRRPAQTPYTQASPLHLRPPPSIQPRTDKDVFAVSTSRRQEIQQEMEDRLARPWRTQEIVPPPEPFHPSDLTLPQPNQTLQPLPSGSATTDTPTVG